MADKMLIIPTFIGKITPHVQNACLAHLTDLFTVCSRKFASSVFSRATFQTGFQPKVISISFFFSREKREREPVAFCCDFSFALFLSRQAVTKQMRDERERERERERGMWREERDRESNGPYFLDGGARIYSALSLFFSPSRKQ